MFEPQDAEADRGAHGAFDDQAHAHDPWLWATMHRAPLAGGLLAAAAPVAVLAAVLAAVRIRGRRRRS